MLPIIPDPFKLVVRQIKTEDGYKADPTALKQLEVIRKLLGQADQVISCTDAGREGELIMRYVLEYLGYHKETKRLWISSMTEKSIREGFDSLKSSKEFDNLYRAAKARRESDWVVGMNASLSLRKRGLTQLQDGGSGKPMNSSCVSHAMTKHSISNTQKASIH